MLLEIHRNECCEAVSSREREQVHKKSMSQTACSIFTTRWYAERSYATVYCLSVCLSVRP